jgi:AraC-like DNA-binding protein
MSLRMQGMVWERSREFPNLGPPEGCRMTFTAKDQPTPSVLPSGWPHWARTIIPVDPRQALHTFNFSDVAGQFPASANFVEGIADWDIPDSKIARDFAVMVLPSTTPYVIVQYRTPMASSRKFRDAKVPHRGYQHIVTTVQTGIVTICPEGPVGAVIARLKPEAAACLLGDPIQEFADTKVDLGAVFDADEVNFLAERLAESRCSYDRITAVLRFLLANVRPHGRDPVVYRAAAHLRSNPSLRVGVLAAELGLSERHLSRKFNTVFGIGPKRFARIARVEHVLAACGRGAAWADIAYSCGFTDQAHMVNDFNAILGATPDHLFRAPLTGQYRKSTTAP